MAAVALATPALAADLRVKAPPPPAPPPSPWDIAFGAGITSDYIFRGITQSNHKPSVNAYFEPRYNVTPYLQLYVGIAGSSISFPNRAAAEIDGYAGIRPTFGPLALDFGGVYYWYPGGTCFNGSVAPVFGTDCLENGFLPVNGNVIKKDLSFWEVVRQGHLHGERSGLVRRRRVSIRRRCSIPAPTAPTCPAARSSRRRAPRMPEGWGLYLSGEAGHWFLGTSDAFYGGRRVPERHSLQELHHLERRHRHHQERVHARLPLLRHRPEQG